MKRHKEPVKPCNTNGDAQVFVLPPDLLEKLGIQLSNIASSTATYEDTSVNQDLKHDEEVLPENVANSSILETANLMKQSVFMSPTFVTNSETANEHTVSNITTQTAEAVQDVQADNQINTVDNVQIIVKAEDEKPDITKEAPYNVASEDFMKYEPMKEYEVDNESGDLVLTNSKAFYNNTVMNGLIGISPIDEHVDEAYLSDGSNSNHGTVTELSNNNSTEHQKPKSKIKILSEQIINNSDFNVINKTQIHKKGSCFLIPVSTIVTGKVTKDCPSIQSNHNVVQDELYKTISEKTETRSIIKNVSIVNNRLTIKDIVPRSQFMDTDNEVANNDDDTNSEEMFNENDTQNRLNGDISAERKEKVNAVCSNTEEASNTENTLKDVDPRSQYMDTDNDFTYNGDDTNSKEMFNKNYTQNRSNGDISAEQKEKVNAVCSNTEEALNTENTIKDVDPRSQSMDTDNDVAYNDDDTNSKEMFNKNDTQKRSNGDISAEQKEKVNAVCCNTEEASNTENTIKDVDPRSQFMDTDNEVAYNDDDTNSKELFNKNGTKNRSKGEISAEQKEKVNAACSNTEEASNTENTLMKSKLSIQGVEKPGGYQCDNVLKTYQRTNIQKRLPEIIIDNTKIEYHVLEETVQTDLDDINISGGNEFCICSDYGRLGQYDCDDPYEHLHFHNQSNVVCNLETLLSMYEDALLLDRTEIEYTEMVDDVVEATAFNICWPSMVSEDKNETEEPAVLENSIKCRTNSGQPRRSNRKQKSTTEQLADKVKPKSKTTIECGACGLLLLEGEWNKHKDSAHSLIAWRDDQPIVKSTTSEQDETTGNDNQSEKPQPRKKSLRNLILGTGTSKPGSKLSPDKKPTPKSPKTEKKDPQNVIDIRHVEVNYIIKSKVTPKVDHQIKVKSTRKSMLDSMDASKAEEKDIPKSVDSPKEKECGVRLTRRSTIRNKNTFQTKLTNKTESNDTVKKEENSAKAIKNKIILPANETANITDITKSSKEKDTVKTPRKIKTKDKTPNADLKTTRRSNTDVKDGLEANDEEITKPKTTVKHSIDLKKKTIPDHIYTTSEVMNSTPKLMRTSTDGCKNTQKAVKEIGKEKVTHKLEMQATLDLSRNTSKPSRTKQSSKSQEVTKPEIEGTQKSTLLFSKTEITSKSYSSMDTILDVVEHSKSTSKNDKDEILSENAAHSKCHKKDIVDRASLQSEYRSSPHSKIPSTEVTTTPIKETATGRLKEIDLFSSTTSCKKNITYIQKSIIKSPIGKSHLKSPKNSLEQSSKPKRSNTSEEIISHNLKRKSVDGNASARTSTSLKDENKLTGTTTDCVAEPPSKRERSSINSNFTLNKTKNNDKELKEASSSAKKPKNTKDRKSNVKLQEVSSSIICSPAASAEPLEIAASTEKDDHSLPNTQIMSANTTTAGNSTTAPSNSQSTDAGGASSSNSDQNVTSSSNLSSNLTSEGSDKDNPPPADKAEVINIKQEVKPKCAVCKQEVDDSHWLEHIAKEHNYLAWRENETPLELEDEEAIRVHLCAIAKRYGELKCFKCNTVRKYARAYRTHVRNCGLNESQLDASTASVDMDTTHDPDDVPLSRCKDEGTQRQLRRREKVVSSDTGDVTSPNTNVNEDVPIKPRRRSRKVVSGPPQDVTCAVCNETVTDDKWIEHIRLEHKYLAWKIGDPPLDVTDDIEVKIFLQNISKHNGGLICSKCGTVRYYVKKWFEHEADCTGDVAHESSSSEDIPIARSANATANVIENLPDVVKCGKCGKEMPSKAWMDHIETEHGYLAWIEGHPPLDLNDAYAVNAHLHALMKKQGALYCAKCGISRKYPKAFLTHISACEISGFKREDFYVEASADVRPDEYECAVCLEKGPINDWKKHAMDKHYNIAWMAGQVPINLKNPYAVEKYLKEYRLKHNLICKVCGASRTSCYGFYAHILTCGKSESQLANLMGVCEVCNNKYLCIYRNQHMQMHREKQRKDEQKVNNAIKAEEEKKRLREEDGVPMGKRRAAQRAKKVMENSDKPNGNHVCLTCHIGFDNQNLLSDHVCEEPPRGDESDSDASMKIEGEAEESEDDMDVDSCVSEEEQDPIRRERKKHSDSSQPKIVLPFKLNNLSRYCEKSFENFCDLHYSRASLFHDWRSKELMMLPEEEAASYLPSLTDSCKIHLGDEWCTLTRFEGLKKRDSITLFTGAAIRCMQWVPNNIACEEQINYLSISCYQHADCPRYGINELHQHPGLIQIWNMDSFMSTPKFEFGIAHDFGTVWAMDWCPSGGRDLVPTDTDFKGGQFRLGLLGVACSNGSAYILSVPLIQTPVGAGPKICRPKPVAELRISSKPKDVLSRTGYQATSISWSPQKGHEIVLVGYSDGTTALYNLNTKSAFLKSMENGVHIFYPFHDALTENSSVTGVSLSASQDLRRIIGGVASSSVTGATMSAWPGATPVARSHLSTSGIAATPNWPAALLCSDDLLTTKATNVLEWWGGGRRFGSACTAGGCGRCGRLAVAAPPFVRLLRPHPAYTDIKKQIIATLKMVPIAQKRKLKTDDLGMVVEPLTYDETIKKYGLEFRVLPKRNQKPSKLCNAVEQCPERFPLSEMPSVAFCPSPRHHNRLAVASHAGLVFIIIA